MMKKESRMKKMIVAVLVGLAFPRGLETYSQTGAMKHWMIQYERGQKEKRREALYHINRIDFGKNLCGLTDLGVAKNKHQLEVMSEILELSKSRDPEMRSELENAAVELETELLKNQSRIFRTIEGIVRREEIKEIGEREPVVVELGGTVDFLSDYELLLFSFRRKLVSEDSQNVYITRYYPFRFEYESPGLLNIFPQKEDYQSASNVVASILNKKSGEEFLCLGKVGR